MKTKFIIICITTAVVLSGCVTARKVSSREERVGISIESKAAADLAISPQKIQYTYYPTSDVKGTDLDNIIKTAIAKALEACNNADVLVEMNYNVTGKLMLWGKWKVESIVLTGYPAYYTNFRSISESGEIIPYDNSRRGVVVDVQDSQNSKTVKMGITEENQTDNGNVINQNEIDEYYIAYLIKSRIFNKEYTDEIKRIYNMDNISLYINQYRDSQLRVMGKNHTKSLSKYEIKQ